MSASALLYEVAQPSAFFKPIVHPVEKSQIGNRTFLQEPGEPGEHQQFALAFRGLQLLPAEVYDPLP
jgi:hypothetical protein